MTVIDFAADRRQFLATLVAAMPLGACAAGLTATGLFMLPAEPDRAVAARRYTLTGFEMIDVRPDGA